MEQKTINNFDYYYQSIINNKQLYQLTYNTALFGIAGRILIKNFKLGVFLGIGFQLGNGIY